MRFAKRQCFSGGPCLEKIAYAQFFYHYFNQCRRGRSSQSDLEISFLKKKEYNPRQHDVAFILFFDCLADNRFSGTVSMSHINLKMIEPIFQPFFGAQTSRKMILFHGKRNTKLLQRFKRMLPASKALSRSVTHPYRK